MELFAWSYLLTANINLACCCLIIREPYDTFGLVSWKQTITLFCSYIFPILEQKKLTNLKLKNNHTSSFILQNY